MARGFRLRCVGAHQGGATATVGGRQPVSRVPVTQGRLGKFINQLLLSPSLSFRRASPAQWGTFTVAKLCAGPMPRQWLHWDHHKWPWVPAESTLLLHGWTVAHTSHSLSPDTGPSRGALGLGAVAITPSDR